MTTKTPTVPDIRAPAISTESPEPWVIHAFGAESLLGGRHIDSGRYIDDVDNDDIDVEASGTSHRCALVATIATEITEWLSEVTSSSTALTRSVQKLATTAVINDDHADATDVISQLRTMAELDMSTGYIDVDIALRHTSRPM